MGRRRLGSPTRIDYFDRGQDKVMKNPAAVREGSGKPLLWPFGPHVAVNKSKITHTSHGDVLNTAVLLTYARDIPSAYLLVLPGLKIVEIV